MTENLFFYGSLRHAPLLQIVLGRSLTSIAPQAAVLRDYAAFAVKEGPFPTLVPQTGAQAEGLLVQGLTSEDIARLNFYEGGFQYDLVDVVLTGDTTAKVYMCAPDRWTAMQAWDVDEWALHWGQMSCFAASEVMGHYGKITAEDVAQMFSQIRGRAWSKVLALEPRPLQGVLKGKLDIIEMSRAYTGYFAVDEVALRHEQFDGQMSEVLHRSYFVAGDAALVLPYDPVRDRVLVVEQMRMGPLGRGDPQVWQLEPIAGRVDPGETGEQAALREAKEEAGLSLTSLETVAKGYPSPGDSTGYYHIFVGVTDLPDDTAGIGGLETEDENIRSRLISFDDFLAMAERQALSTTPVTLLAYWLAHHRSRLRSAA